VGETGGSAAAAINASGFVVRNFAGYRAYGYPVVIQEGDRLFYSQGICLHFDQERSGFSGLYFCFKNIHFYIIDTN
jgi:hypothetical protein